MAALNKQPRRVLIFGHSNIGDVCYDMAAVAPVRAAFPDARVSFITSPQARDVPAVAAGIDEIIIFDKYGADRGFTGMCGFIRRLRARRFSGAVILRDTQLPLFLNIPRILRRRKIGAADHPALAAAAVCARGGGAPAAPQFNFSFSAADERFVREIFADSGIAPGQPVIGIMPFGNWKLKCWPVRYWNEVTGALRRQWNAPVIMFGKSSPADSWEDDFLRNIDRRVINLVDRCSLRQSIAVLPHLRALVGIDTSLVHLSSCLQVPTVSLYGPSGFDRFYPFFHRGLLATAQPLLRCQPCYRRAAVGSCGVKGQP
ncbi:MAG: glycosyltransferase family 9 protein, partial [Candidatus Omnitrophica bacterium]|nr:glycosyltransferase family 9 protein [Candidatus Omnitrophota bacterium]